MLCEKCNKEPVEYEVIMTDLETYFIGKNCRKDYRTEILEINKFEE